ncbi:hypothetical protein, partial [Acinetobacter sp.]|uniref:hypothetical protein n=1 Tax=Acinetobacter sp. TaxID=472 RepID=UPI002FC83A6A
MMGQQWFKPLNILLFYICQTGCENSGNKKAQVMMLGLFYEIGYLEYGVPTGIRTPVTAVK